MADARRYIAVIQDPRGYPPPGADLEPAPPEGPSQPVLHSVVAADEYERVQAERDRLAEALREIADRPGPYGGCLDLHEARTIAREALGGERENP